MQRQNRHFSQGLVMPGSTSGNWTLAAGQALSLRPTTRGVLRISGGKVWLTFGEVPLGDTVRSGDHFLAAGDVLDLLPVESLVLESLATGYNDAAGLMWAPAYAASRSPWASSRLAPQAASLQPLRALREALGKVALALWRAGRGRFTLAARARNAQSSASRAQGAIKCGDSIASSGAL